MDMVNVARSKELLSDIAVNRCRALVFMGNSGAHPQDDPLREIGPDDALEGLRLTRRVLLELYDSSALTADD